MRKTTALALGMAAIAWLARRGAGRWLVMIDKKAFRTAIEAAARQLESETGIPPRISLIQAALESAWGTSRLALAPNFNLFGYTAGKRAVWNGREWVAAAGHQIVVLETWEDLRRVPLDSFPKAMIVRVEGHRALVKRPFRKYSSWLESLRDWARLISTAPRYRAAYEAAKRGDVDEFAQAMGRSGYATDAGYGSKLARVGADPEVATA